MNLQNEFANDPLLRNRYQFLTKIGEGCFGKIYKVRNRQLNIYTALKIQLCSDKLKKTMLQNQSQILTYLSGKPFVPKLYNFGEWNLGTFLQIQLLSSDLSKLVSKKFSFQQITQLTIRLMHSLSILHSSNVIHQDIKPQNIMQNQNGDYFFIDFGISKIQKDKFSLCKRARGFVGTPRYASLQAHFGLEQSKKDDLQSLMFNIAYLYFKKVPWLNLKKCGVKKIQQIKKIKIKTSKQLFQAMGKPFVCAYDYIKSLQHKQQPNYRQLLSIFKRTKTMVPIPIPIQSILSTPNRSQQKKLSLNLQNLSQLPLYLQQNQKKNPFLTIQSSQHQMNNSMNNSKNSKNSKNSRSRSINSKGNNSINVYYGNQSLEGWKIKEDETRGKRKDMNLEDQETQEFRIPKVIRFLNPIAMKNPFCNHA